MDQHIIWYELQEAEADKPVEFLRAGTFTDRHGKVVTITPDDLDAYAANFEAGASGQDVPIDEMHKREEAFGWVRKVWRDGEKLLATVDWNEIGHKTVGKRIYRYLSASLDTANKVIRSISLVNFPAVKGLAPVELSEGVMGLEAEPGLVERVLTAVKAAFDRPADFQSAQEGAPIQEEAPMVVENEANLQEEQIREKVRAEMEAELAEREAELAEMRAKVRAELEAEMAEKAERRGKLREFAEEVCNGDAALSAKPEDVVDALEDLSDEQAERVQALLRAKVVDLSERGTSREAGGKKQLPKRIIREVKEGNLTIADLSDPILALGDLNDYDLSELTDKED